ncbi:hypothetical protein Cylst_4014 [Cylindrospermum stagnale PCC 7417]|uniref:Uncharacterized protein n=1 Tax=Cylindrospermum stagnale PCC 7417 TaxID=56107 RepID=K9X236_9NOST|nr:hypothetical protein [Cylindrospermum stagnale]AFZ26124.1 hypothetical protein Cylst_4014 [Cylindrospermum stagnale PCC 7417]
MRTKNAPTGKVEFIQYHQPVMESGEYILTVEQAIALRAAPEAIAVPDKINETFSREITFVVAGERFGPLAPADIHAVFPPANTIGDHSNVLPHITLKRSTLPWERFPDSGVVDKNLTWLVLLLFRESDFTDESEKPKLQSVTLKELLATPTNIKFPTITIEPGQHQEEPVNVIDVKKKFLQPLFPTIADLAFLAHTRQTKDADDNAEGEQLSTILCDRLPEPQGVSTVYLVSVEGRYGDGDDGSFDFMGAGDEDLIRLVTLASWSFGCVDPAQSFTQLLLNLNGQPSSPRLPINSDPAAENFLVQSYIPLPHALREGSKTVSWYRGPLISGSQPDSFDLPVRAADELLRYDSSTGLFDCSYGAAWQLGRMLTLQNQRLAIELYNWKRENAQNLKQLEQQVINPPLRSSRQLREEIISIPEAIARSAVPEAIADWFKKLELLQGLPFNYLIPDERLLPAESIRFFWVDSVWVDCLQDGAFSVGRVTPTDVEQDGKMRSSRALRSDDRTITGCILRSQVVSGWPNLLVEAYDTVVNDIGFIAPDEATPLKLLRMEKLAPDVLICLFQGEVKTVDIHQKPEGMHFGLDAPSDESDKFTKNLRNPAGEGSEVLIIKDIPWRDEAKGNVNISAMVDEMKKLLPAGEFTSAQFGLQMIEGVQKVRFLFTP